MSKGAESFIDKVFEGRKNPKFWNISLFGIDVFCCYYSNKLGWFRIFGKGLSWKEISKHPLLFSERYGYKKTLKIGNWVFGLLK